MSRNIKVLISTIFWIPFSFLLFWFFKGYANHHLIQNMQSCGQSFPTAKSEKAEIANFVTCLKEKSKPIVWWYLEPERLYQMAQPHTPCQWVGRWQAKRGNMSFAINLDAYGKYQIDYKSVDSYNNQPQNEDSFAGVWSSPQLNRIIWFNNARFWPIDDNSVEWLNQDQLVIEELNGTKTYYQRQSSRLAGCPAYP